MQAISHPNHPLNPVPLKPVASQKYGIFPYRYQDVLYQYPPFYQTMYQFYSFLLQYWLYLPSPPLFIILVWLLTLSPLLSYSFLSFFAIISLPCSLAVFFFTLLLRYLNWILNLFVFYIFRIFVLFLYVLLLMVGFPVGLQVRFFILLFWSRCFVIFRSLLLLSSTYFYSISICFQSNAALITLSPPSSYTSLTQSSNFIAQVLKQWISPDCPDSPFFYPHYQHPMSYYVVKQKYQHYINVCWIDQPRLLKLAQLNCYEMFHIIFSLSSLFHSKINQSCGLFLLSLGIYYDFKYEFNLKNLYLHLVQFLSVLFCFGVPPLSKMGQIDIWELVGLSYVPLVHYLLIILHLFFICLNLGNKMEVAFPESCLGVCCGNNMDIQSSDIDDHLAHSFEHYCFLISTYQWDFHMIFLLTIKKNPSHSISILNHAFQYTGQIQKFSSFSHSLGFLFNVYFFYQNFIQNSDSILEITFQYISFLIQKILML